MRLQSSYTDYLSQGNFQSIYVEKRQALRVSKDYVDFNIKMTDFNPVQESYSCVLGNAGCITRVTICKGRLNKNPKRFGSKNDDSKERDGCPEALACPDHIQWPSENPN